jgi:hypothetical protein
MRSSNAIRIAIAILGIVLLSWYYGLIGTFAGLGWSLLVLVLQNYDKVLQVSADLLAIFSSISDWSERRAVVNFLQGTINLSASEINRESAGLLPHPLRVEIVKPIDRETFLREGQVVVCMESSRSRDRNLARGALFYVAEDLVRDSRRFIDPVIIRACDFAVTRKMLMSDNRIDALRSLNDEFLDQEARRDADLRSYVLGMDDMDAQGTLTRILLREFADLGPRLSPKLSDIQAERESSGFTDRLVLLAHKQTGIDVDPTYEGDIIRVGIMPIARAEVSDIKPYVKYARRCFSNKVPILYVLARGLVNISVARMTIREIESLRLYKKIDDSQFTFTRKGEVTSYISRCMLFKR